MRLLKFLVVCMMLLASTLAAQNAGRAKSAPDQHRGMTAATVCKPGTCDFSGVVKKGKKFSRGFGGFVFTLEPIQHGWTIDISQGDHHYLANLTPPRHSVPNPIDIEGWHFRNQANTGPNTGDVNAPDEHREFFFSPKFNTCMKDPESAPQAEFEAAARDGKGTLEITDLTLGNLKPGEKADIDGLKFTVHLTVAKSACEACRAAASAHN